MNDNINIDGKNLLVPASVDNAVKNVTGPPTKNIGKTLGDFFFMVFSEYSLKADKRRIECKVALEEYEKECRAKIEAIPDEKRIEPSLHVTASALEASKYCIENKDIRSMFANLISSTMNSDTVDLAHPCFPEIIRQMSSLDAHILQLFRHSPVRTICEYRLAGEDYKFTVLKSNIFLDEDCDMLTDTINRRALSISALEHLGLLTVSYLGHLTDDELYNQYYKTKMYTDYVVEANIFNRKIDVAKGVVKLTPLGERLLSVCCPIQFDEIDSAKAMTADQRS